MAAVFIAVSLAFVAVLLWRQWTSLDEVLAGARDFEWRVHAGWLATSLVLAVADLVLMGSVWMRLFRRTGGSTSWWHGVRVWVITNFGRYIPGKVWQLGGLTAYMKARGESGAAALVSAVVFQVVTLVTGTAIAAATVGLRWAADDGSLIPSLVTLMVLVGVGLHPAVLRAATRRLGGLMGEDEVEVRVRGADIAVAAFGMLLAWAVYGAGFVSLLLGIGVDWPLSEWGLATGIFAASYVVGYLALVAPGGLVVREGAMTGLLAEVAKLPIGVGALVAVAARVWLIAAELLALALVLVVSGPDSRLES